VSTSSPPQALAQVPAPAIRAFAARESGVHGISDAEAARLIREEISSPGAGAQTPIVWIDVLNPGEREANYLRDEVGFHPLAVEDCVRGRQRPKMDRYDEYLFLVLYASAINPERNRMALNELHVFLGHRFIVTVHDYKVEEVGEILARWRTTPRDRVEVANLAYMLFDAIVDDYFPVLEHFSERAERFETSIFEQGGPPGMDEILILRQELVTFRRIVAPQREVLSSLLRRDLPVLRPELMPYFQDVHDHIIRVTEEIDAQRELLSALLDAQFSISANRLNHTMRTMTAWSIILMSITLIAGVYGMNFAYMPELHWRAGYFMSLALMAGVGAGLIAFFRHRNWL
jgi:magnesium transporter